ncbi:Hypothetical predicted protein [Pelobates cultripes]|uniref:Uncharacterized protein n=1 Tax=Pelobates cultripes TaxID=61616 RepID=A0AAD1RD17_PELCU|nr:Hypothetical predicted protein [Pelobates cultripes]
MQEPVTATRVQRETWKAGRRRRETRRKLEHLNSRPRVSRPKPKQGLTPGLSPHRSPLKHKQQHGAPHITDDHSPRRPPLSFQQPTATATNRDIRQRQRAQHLPHPCTAAKRREPEKPGPPRAPTTSGGPCSNRTAQQFETRRSYTAEIMDTGK